MERTYDIFERLQDGTLLWVEVVHGHEEAIRKLRLWAEKRPNEFRLMHLPSNTLIATTNNAKE